MYPAVRAGEEWGCSGWEDGGKTHVYAARHANATRGYMRNTRSERFGESPCEHASCTGCSAAFHTQNK